MIFNFEKLTISSGFGPRKHPISGKRKMHKGVDFRAPVGTPITSTRALLVVRKGFQAGGAGHFVVLGEPGTSTEHKLFHLDKPVTHSERTLVSAGTIIGYSGKSGGSTGPHIHWEKWMLGRAVDPVRERGGAILPKPMPQASIVSGVAYGAPTEVLVRSQDTVDRILRRFGWPAARLKDGRALVVRENDLADVNRIRVGQTLTIRRFK